MAAAQLLLLTTGLSLISVVQANEWPLLTAASSEELLGKWYIRRWAGNMPIPAKKKSRPLPPFMFTRNNLGRLEFRMQLRKTVGCIQFKLSLDEFDIDGIFHAWALHFITIQFLPGKDHAVAYYKGQMDRTFYKMMMLMGRTLQENPGPVSFFEGFVERRGLNRTEVINPPHDDACELAGDSQRKKGARQRATGDPPSRG